MTITSEHIRQALGVRRGERRLSAVPEADRAAVQSVLWSTSDATFATLAAAEEHRASRASAANALVYAKLRRARSC
jgi:hypothetical protein